MKHSLKVKSPLTLDFSLNGPDPKCVRNCKVTSYLTLLVLKAEYFEKATSISWGDVRLIPRFSNYADMWEQARSIWHRTRDAAGRNFRRQDIWHLPYTAFLLWDAFQLSAVSQCVGKHVFVLCSVLFWEFLRFRGWPEMLWHVYFRRTSFNMCCV